ncbi:MAG: hypothetical protein GY940_17000 [bacterium]|nr:hypothetical protein [bacterium]
MKSDELLDRIRIILELLREGRYGEIDFSAIEEHAPSIVDNIRHLITTLDSTGKDLSTDNLDLPIIIDHLSHVSKSTETGVLNVLNTAEILMTDAAEVIKGLEELEKQIPDDSPDKETVRKMNDALDNIQNNSFSILTALEFDDINQQLMGKIMTRLDEANLHLIHVLSKLKLELNFAKEESKFLENLKHIIDLEDNTRQSQDMIDDFFEDFDT